VSDVSLDPRLRPFVRLARWLERDEDALSMPARRARSAAAARRGRWS
jgi:hypothetical protein